MLLRELSHAVTSTRGLDAVATDLIGRIYTLFIGTTHGVIIVRFIMG